MSHTESPSADSVPVSQRVVRTVAETTGTDPVDLEPLFDAVDPESLDALFEPTRGGSPRADGTVTFEYAGCTVTVRADGTVEVTASSRSDSRTTAPDDD